MSKTYLKSDHFNGGGSTADPSESVRSSEILPVFEMFFEVLEYRPYRGALLQMLLADIVGNFIGGPQLEGYVSVIAEFEDILTESGMFSDDFDVIVGRPKQAWMQANHEPDIMLEKIFDTPAVYQAFQVAGGFFGARLKAISEFLDLHPGTRIIDIGCGPGYIVKHLPSEIDYIGFDITPSYILHASQNFSHLGRFLNQFFDADAARKFFPADLVMMNGVLHHIPDEELLTTLRNVRDVLRPGGLLFSLDGCYRPGQSSVRKWMLDNDRGRFVRDEAGYRKILVQVFDQVSLSIRENYSRFPYTFVVGLSRKSH
jgi:SAM-dependent methyltransferase